VSTIRERLAWEVTPELYERVRRLWIAHSRAEDKRSLEGLLATLSPDCVYELVPTGARCEGHQGATGFYTSFLGAFPDVRFDLQDIVIGPQGVIEVTRLSGTWSGPWSGREATGERVELDVVIHFPWDPEAGLFAGERVYFDSSRLG